MSGYEYEGNLDEDVWRKFEVFIGFWRIWRIIDEDDDDNDSKDGEDLMRIEGKKGNECDNEDSLKEKVVILELKGNWKDDKKLDNEWLKMSVNGGEVVKINVVSLGSEVEVGVVNILFVYVFYGNKIYLYLRIVFVVLVVCI